MGTLSDTKLRSLNPRTSSYQMADGEGFYVEVLPSGAISFRYEYRIAGHKERVVLGTYPTMSLAKARQKHREFQTMVEHGRSPAHHVQQEKAKQRGSGIPWRHSPALGLRSWGMGRVPAR